MKISKRKEKNLGELCRRFVLMYGDDSTSVISLDYATQRLGVERRRIYDIVNILESFEVVSRRAKNTYNWHGISKIPETITKLSSNLTISKIRKSKSLCQLCREFVKLFIHGEPIITLKSAAKAISEDAENAKTTIRRLYDIANALSCLNLTKKTQVERKPAFIWKGVSGFTKFIREANGPTTNDMTIWAPSPTTTPNCDAFFNNVLSTLRGDQEELKQLNFNLIVI